jgi:hypothetical protein
MVNRFLQPLHRWPAAESLITRLAGRLAMAGTPSPVDQTQPATATDLTPETFEMRFMRLHAHGMFDEMWEMLAEDAQRAWGGRETFVKDMPRFDGETELLDIQVVDVSVLEGWTDREHQRTYSNVARMTMRYRVRRQWREWTLDRQVHLVPAAGGWRTLCYPQRTAVGR